MSGLVVKNRRYGLFNSHKKRTNSEPIKINPLLIANYAHDMRCRGHRSTLIGPAYQNNQPIGQTRPDKMRMGARAARTASSNGAVFACFQRSQDQHPAAAQNIIDIHRDWKAQRFSRIASIGSGKHLTSIKVGVWLKVVSVCM